MARLSVEHFKSNPNTPQPERHKNRLRDMFKPRSSSSASTSPAVLTKNQLTSPTSSSMSPTIKPGFEQIGLLPSERSSLETTRQTHNEASDQTFSEKFKNDLEKYEQSINPNCTTTPTKPTAEDSDTAKPAMSTSPFPNSSTSTPIDFSSSPPAPPSNKSNTKIAVQPPKRFGHAAVVPLETSVVHTLTTAPSSPSLNGTPKKSLPINIFDDADPLSQGIREYVAAQIGKAMAEQVTPGLGLAQTAGGTTTTTTTTTTTIAAQLKPHIDMANTAFKTLTQYNSSPLTCFPRTLFTLPLPLNPATATFTHHTTILLSTLTLLHAALSGPKDLFLALWRGAVVMGVYVAVVKWLDPRSDGKADVVLGSVIWIVERVKGWGGEMLDGGGGGGGGGGGDAAHTTSAFVGGGEKGGE
ncbi:hypothetical protein NX059_011448 [Plenodomus lindquistii]|nr:hypothetical protein NX059_011448 [Plenodomus lindquistii]